MSNWKSRAVTRAAESVRRALKGTHHSDFVLASALRALRSALDDGEFRSFCLDEEDGLAVAANTSLKFERMISAVSVIETEKVWDKVGWDGIKKVVKITARNERVAVCRAICRQDKPIGKQSLLDIIEEKAPSYSATQGRRRGGGGPSKTALERENRLLKRVMVGWLAKYPVLRNDVTEEIEAILESETAPAD